MMSGGDDRSLPFAGCRLLSLPSASSTCLEQSGEVGGFLCQGSSGEKGVYEGVPCGL